MVTVHRIATTAHLRWGRWRGATLCVPPQPLQLRVTYASMLPAFKEDSKATQEYHYVQLKVGPVTWTEHPPPVSPGDSSFSKDLYRLSL